MARHLLEIEERGERRYDVALKNTPQQSQLWERHHQVIRMYIMGMKQAEICRHTGFSAGFISTLLSSPIAREQIAVMTASRDATACGVAAMLQEYAPKAALHLMSVIDGRDADGDPVLVDPKAKIQVCQDWLSRTGFSPIQRGTFETVNKRGLDDDTVVELKRRAVKNAQADAGFSLPKEETFTDAEIVNSGSDDAGDSWTAAD